MPIAHARVAEIYAWAGGVVGSGYVLGDKHVLTACHVVRGLVAHADEMPVKIDVGPAAQVQCQARCLGAEKFVAVTSIWADLRHDIALLEAAEPLLIGDLPAVPWGRCATGASYACQAVGFPRGATTGRRHDTHALIGQITPHKAAKAGFSLHVTPQEAARLRRAEDWQGMSGSGVFVGDRLVGVVRSVDRRQASLTAHSAQRVRDWLGPLAIVGLALPDSAELVAPEWAAFEGREHADRVQRRLAELSALVAGRSEQLDELDECLAQRPSVPALVIGAAGHGKSALLAAYAQRRSARGDAVIAFLFSSRSGLTKVVDGLRALCWQLERAMQFQVEPTMRAMDTEGEARRRLLELIERWQEVSAGQLVVVIDGLDEAERWFEPPLPDVARRVSVVASVRADGSRPPLELPDGWGASRALSPLSPLGSGGVSAWLAEAGGGELGALAQDDHAVDRLVLATEGLPVYLAFVVDDLIAAASETGRAEVLANVPRGFSEYVERELTWLERKDLSRKQTRTRALFALMTVSIEPLPWSEIEAVTGLRPDELRALPHRVRRWLGRSDDSVAGPGYAFAHPLLAREFGRQLGTSETDRQQKRLLAHCRRWRSHKGVFALRSYARQLRHAARDEDLTALCALAEDAAYARAQRDRFPDRDEHLETLKTAIGAALEGSHAAVVARLLVAYGREVEERAGESPLAALRAVSLPRALMLARLQDPGTAALWCLLVMAELLAAGRSDLARDALMTADQLTVASATGWQATLAGGLLVHANRLDRDIARDLRRRMLDCEYEVAARSAASRLGEVLATAGDLEQAEEIAAVTGHPSVRSAIMRRQAADGVDVLPAFRAIDVARRYTAIGLAAADNGLPDEAASAFASARHVATGCDAAGRSLRPDARADILAAIARLQADAGQAHAATTTAMDIEDGDRRLDALLDAALAKLRLGHDTAPLLVTYEDRLTHIATDWPRARRLAEVWARSGRPALARRLLRESGAMETSRRSLRQPARFQVLETRLLCGLDDEPDAVLEDARESEVALALRGAITTLIRRGELIRASALAQRVSNPSDQRFIAAFLTSASDPMEGGAEARRWAERALLLDGKRGELSQRAPLIHVAEALTDIGHLELATTVADALDAYERTSAYDAIGRICASDLERPAARPAAARAASQLQLGVSDTAAELLTRVTSAQVPDIADAAAEGDRPDVVEACIARLNAEAEHAAAERVLATLVDYRLRTGEHAEALRVLWSSENPCAIALRLAEQALVATGAYLELLIASCHAHIQQPAAVAGMVEIAQVLVSRGDDARSRHLLIDAANAMARVQPTRYEPRADATHRVGSTDLRPRDEASAMLAAAAHLAVLTRADPKTRPLEWMATRRLERLALRRVHASYHDDVFAFVVLRLAANGHHREAKAWLRRVTSAFERASLVRNARGLGDDLELVCRAAEEIPTGRAWWARSFTRLAAGADDIGYLERLLLLAATSTAEALALGGELVRIYPDQARSVTEELLRSAHRPDGDER